jgi:ferredoxin-nitrite reductase
VAAIIADTHAKNDFEQTVSCVGATICQIGFQDSSGLVKVVKDTLESEGLSTDRLPQLHVSGCLSSCGTHQVGSLGLHGFTKLVDKQPQPAFKVFINGNGELEGPRMSDEVGVITVADLPNFFIDLAKVLNAAGQDFDTWIAEEPEAFQAVLAKYL